VIEQSSEVEGINLEVVLPAFDRRAVATDSLRVLAPAVVGRGMGNSGLSGLLGDQLLQQWR
jgi:hypothetical protein